MCYVYCIYYLCMKMLIICYHVPFYFLGGSSVTTNKKMALILIIVLVLSGIGVAVFIAYVIKKIAGLWLLKWIAWQYS